MRTDSSYLCLDYDEHTFKELISACGSIEAVYEQYYRSIYSSIVASLGVYKPKRVGHITLVQKFIKLFPYSMSEHIRGLVSLCLNAIEENGMELDFNTSGLRKTYAGGIYIEDWMLNEAKQRRSRLCLGLMPIKREMSDMRMRRFWNGASW